MDKTLHLILLNAAYQNLIYRQLEQIRINQYLKSGSFAIFSFDKPGIYFSQTTNPQGFNQLNQAYGPIVGAEWSS